MAQLMQRISNGEEIIDEKTRECEEQKIIIRELRKESETTKSKLEAFEKAKFAPVRASQESILEGSGSLRVKRLNFDDLPEDTTSDSPHDKSGRSVSEQWSPAGAKQFRLSDDEQSDGDDENGSVDRRRALWRSFARMEVELKKEGELRREVEQKLHREQQERNLAMSSERLRHNREMEELVRDCERTKKDLLRTLDQAAQHASQLQAKLVEAEKKVQSKERELSRIRAVENISIIPGSPTVSSTPDITSGDSRSSSVWAVELEMIQEEIEEKSHLLLEKDRQLEAALEQRDVALAKIESLQGSLQQADRDMRALRSSKSKNILSSSSPSISAASSLGLRPPPEVAVAPEEALSVQRELEVLRRERDAGASLRRVLVSRLEGEVQRERKRCTQMRNRLLLACCEGKLKEAAEGNLEEEFTSCKEELFYAIGVNAKLNAMTAAGAPCNVDLSALWQKASEDGVDWTFFRTWIQRHVDLLMGDVSKPVRRSSDIPMMTVKEMRAKSSRTSTKAEESFEKFE